MAHILDAKGQLPCTLFTARQKSLSSCYGGASSPIGIKLRRQVVSPFGVAGLNVPQYDIEFRGFIESDVVNSVNPLNSLSYLRNSHPATLYGETTKAAAAGKRLLTSPAVARLL